MSDAFDVSISPSPSRRVIAVAMLMALGGLLIYLAFDPQIGMLIWKALTFLIGIACLFVAKRLWESTRVSLIFTKDGLHDSEGREICAFDNIKKVERGAFAFKPSNGLMIYMHAPLASGWSPGLWWRYGTRLGIGGITDAGEAKAMAEMITLRQTEAEEAKSAKQDNAPD